MRSEKSVKEVAIKSLELIRVYCKTLTASGYTSELSEIIEEEFQPIILECDRAIADLEEM